MANLYRNSNDKWRAYGYQKAITTLKKCQRPVTTYEVRIDIVRFESFFFFFYSRKFECYPALALV